jgi:hypothetical protein
MEGTRKARTLLLGEAEQSRGLSAADGPRQGPARTTLPSPRLAESGDRGRRYARATCTSRGSHRDEGASRSFT